MQSFTQTFHDSCFPCQQAARCSSKRAGVQPGAPFVCGFLAVSLFLKESDGTLTCLTPVVCSMEDLLRRFERPDGRNRWDAPLFTLSPDQGRAASYPSTWLSTIVKTVLLIRLPCNRNFACSSRSSRQTPSVRSLL